MTSTNAGGRLDRLPIGPFHHRLMVLIGMGMFFDGFNIYLAGAVIGATLQTGFSTLADNAAFMSATFMGMMIGAAGTGFIGDRYGRRVTYQLTLLVFGLAAMAAAFAPIMTVLIGCQMVMGIGLGGGNVAGYAALTEFIPAKTRGKWLGLMSVFVVTGLPVALLVASFVVPVFGWRAMFVIGGVGALMVSYLRRKLPESPRWLESVGRKAEAEALLQHIEREASQGRPLPAPAVVPAVATSSDVVTLFRPPLLLHVFVAGTCMITINTLLFGFVTWLPVFFIWQGLSIATSFGYSFAMAVAAPIGATIGAITADHWGRRPTIIGASLAVGTLGVIYSSTSDPAALTAVGFLLMLPIYILVALLFGIYIPELFPTEVRLRATGLAHTMGRGTMIATPFLVVMLFEWRGVAGVMSMMIALLLVQIVVVWAFGVEPRHCSLEEIKGDTLRPAVFKRIFRRHV